MCNHNKNDLGFSLIELMVVIAIVAILAAVAVPTYKDYVFKSNVVGKIVPTLHKLVNESVQYRAKYGYFPFACDLGAKGIINHTSCPPVAGAPDYTVSYPEVSEINPLFQTGSNVYIFRGCNNMGRVAIEITDVQTLRDLGFSVGAAPYVGLQCYIWDSSNVNNIKCMYTITADGSTYISEDNYIPGMLSYNTTAASDVTTAYNASCSN